LEALGPSAGERLLREARAAAKLRHPNIVGVFNVGEDAGVHFLVMEFVEGKSLQKLLDEQGALPVAQALTIAAQLLDALELTFAHRIVQRMKLKALVQKPENIVRFLKHLGEPTEPPPLAAARAPPYWQARELRHRPQAQTELFDA
ncbi:MAG TPA: protein kinase, partial [Polyangia bacterium]|nr:protein kinase [Polyangia bacterium]